MHKILQLLQLINSCESENDRERLHWNLRDALFEKFGDTTWVNIDKDTIQYNYINYDSDCGMTIIDVTMDIKPVVRFMKRKKEKMELLNATHVIDSYFPERNETWLDIVDPDTYQLNQRYSPEDIVKELECLLKDTSDTEDTFTSRYA